MGKKIRNNTSCVTNSYLTKSSSNISPIAKIIKPIEDSSLYEIWDLIVNQNKFKFCKYIENSPVLRLALLYSDLVPSVSHCPISLVYFTTELLSRAAHTYHLYDVFSSSASVPTDASPGKVIFPDQDQSQASSGWTDPSPPPGNGARKRTTLPWVLHSLGYHTPLGTTLPWFFSFIRLSCFSFVGLFSTLCPPNIDAPYVSDICVTASPQMIWSRVTVVWLWFTLGLHA